MSDTALPTIIRFDTTAARMAFTPTPGVAEQLYVWVDSDDQPNSYYWDGGAWVQLAAGAGGSGDVVGPGSAINNDIAVFDGITGKLIKDGGMTIAAVIAAGGGITELTGDVTAGPGTGSQAATIGANKVVTAKVLDKNITYAKIQDITATDRLLGRDTAGSGVTEELSVTSGLEFSGGPGLRTTAAIRTQTFGITVDGGSSVLTSGIKGYRSFPVAGTIQSWRMLANAAGAVAMEIKKADYATFPTMTSITAAAPPNIPATNQKAESSSLGTWTTSVAAGDVFEFSITGSPATITRVTLEVVILVT